MLGKYFKYLVKLYLTINHPLPVSPGNGQDLCPENIVNIYLFYQVCKVHNISVFETSLPMQRNHDTLATDISA